MHPRYLFLILILFATSLTYAQSANDECTTAIPLSDVTNWCSGAAAFSSVGATESTVESPGCFPNTQTANDVWFSFVAQASNVSIGVTGNIANSPSTLNDPQFALYTGSCGSLVELTCQSDAFNANQITAIQAGLEAGETYYIRVSAREGQTGTFELCVNNFSEVPPPDGDCPTGVLLCDRSPFTVDFVSGVGEIPNEIAGNACDDVDCGSALQESSSTWYKWICDEPGPLAFTLTPLNPADDLDFIVFELPNGIDDCSGMEDLRCMFSGENVGSDFADWAPCYGPTGLSQADPDRSESCGCQPGNNNFAAAVQMEAGKAYALVINNYSQSGAGFSIEFDQSPGTGTFLGPEAAFNFTPEVACVGETVSFSDASSFIGDIDTYTWNFGVGAEPRTATGIGPHDVVYNTPGLKTVLLEVTTDRGCIVSRVELATEVICCDDHFMVDADVVNLACPDINDGAIDLSISSDYGPNTYSWSNDSTNEDQSMLEPGDYAVSIVDQAGCELELAFNISTPPSFTFDTLVVMPTCDGGTDGAVTLEVMGGTGPYEWNWENTGFQADNTLPNIMQGDYDVVVRDANGCIISQTLPVRELELLLDPAVQAIEMPSCFGFSDGSITIAINNGLPTYQYNFNDGNGFVNSNMLSGIPAGIYQVDVLDANRCQGNFELVVEDHPPLTLGFEVENVSCFGEEDGAVASLVTGGFGDYRYSWSNSASTADLNNLPAGTYAITVLDENDCVISGDTLVVQPDSLGLDLVEVIDNICFGENNGSATVAANGGNPPYEYSTDGNTFQMSPVLENLEAGTYDLTVLDALGCTAEVEATITEPAELFVNVGGDRLIQLGFDTIVNAFSNYSPVTYEWSPADSLQCLNADCSTVEVNPTSTTTYTVTVINENGCEAINTVTIRVIKDRPVYVPNIFSPNFDGRNDGFTIYGGRGLEKIEKLQIFSRWGSLVFETTNIDPNDDKLGWDGTFLGRPVNPGVFVYVAQVRFVDDSVVQLEGDVTLIR